MNSHPLLDLIVSAAPHRLFFTTITTISAALVAVGALLLRQKSLEQEKWVTYFGIGFLIFSLQYLTPSWIGIEHLLLHGSATGLEKQVDKLASSIASSVNNLFFLATALILLRRKRHFPWWAIAWAAVAVVIDYREILAPWHRFPDAALSILSLGLVGFALFTNLKARRRVWLAGIALLGGILYGLLNVAYALNPLVTQGHLWPAVKLELMQALQHLDWTPELRAMPPDVLARHAVDTSLFAIALVLKAFLAVGGFLLILRALVLISPRFLSKRLVTASSQNVEFFTGGLLLETIGHSLDADRVVICFRLPGLSNPKLTQWTWASTHPEHTESQVIPVPAADESPLGKVLAEGTCVEEHLLKGDTGAPLPPRTRRSFVAVPIKQHGITTGCLRVEWYSAFSFTATAVVQAQRLADLIAPMLEERRQMAALERWGRRSQSLRLGLNSALDTLALTHLVYDTLAPLAVGIFYKVGFQPVWAIASAKGQFSGVVGNLTDEEFVDRVRQQADGAEPVETVLEVKRVSIGILLIAWPPPNGDRRRPVVFSDDLHRKTLAALIAGAMFEAAELGLSNLLNAVQTRLSSRQVQRRDDWYVAIERAATEAGLLWAVAVADDRILGSPLITAVVVSLLERHPEIREQDKPVRLVPHGEAKPPAGKLVSLSLPLSKTTLFLGVGNQGFDAECGEGWPWRNFLERLAEAADSVLARITANEEVERLQHETVKLASILTAGADSAGFIHDIRNLARNFLLAAQSLNEAREFGLLTGPESMTESIDALDGSARRLFEMTDGILQSTPTDPRPAYPLVDPIKKVQELLKPVLAQHRIELEIAVEPSLVIIFPFYLAHQAVVSLVFNSIEAIKECGRIQITAEDSGDWVRCHVIDDGPGVDPEIAHCVFDLGVTTKGKTGGKGLFLVRSLLQDHGAEARLSESRPGHTVFTIDFPTKQSKEGPPHEAKKSTDHR